MFDAVDLPRTHFSCFEINSEPILKMYWTYIELTITKHERYVENAENVNGYVENAFKIRLECILNLIFFTKNFNNFLLVV